MELWCPECNNTTFFYNLLSSTEPVKDEIAIFNDHMRCKKCSYEFDIQWYQYIREGWIEAQPRSFKKRS